MLEVYADPCTVNCRKVLAGLDLLGTDFKDNFVSYFAGEHKSEKSLKLNPCGTVPYATDGDITITESNAIMMYAGDLGSESSAYPKDLKKRAVIHRWLLWEASRWFHSCYVFLVENVVKASQGASPDQKALDDETPKWKELAKILDDQLAKTKFLAGDDVTIADIAVAAPMHICEAQKLPVDEFPNLKRWFFEDIRSLPCWKKSQGPVDKLLGKGNSTSNGANGATKLTQKEIQTVLNYTKDVRPKLTELYYYEHEDAKKVHPPGGDAHEMTVHDGWDRADSFSVDKEGFSIHDFNTSFDNWDDDGTVESKFYPEIVEFLKKTVGAKRILVFDHTIRTRANAAKKVTQETNTSQRAPILLVHCDYTHDSGPMRVRQLLKNEAEDLLSRRVAFFNVWKPIRRVVEEKPLAMCDVTTSPMDDFFKLHLHYREREGENYVMKYSPEHKWYYFPKITPEKVILLKTYDSETDGRARFVGHSAFDDPTSPPDAPFRESVEIRTMAFY